MLLKANRLIIVNIANSDIIIMYRTIIVITFAYVINYEFDVKSIKID